MKPYQRQFIEFALGKQVLKFGEFTLKSGRKSPYFFNAGLFNTGRDLALLGRFYAEALVDSGIEFDLLFGPAYKGIPIATTTAVALAEHHDLDLPYCFNRKEAKDHGEGGNLVGSALQGRVMLVDDVITAGTAIRESMEIIQANGATLAGVLISLDRQERGRGEISAIQEVERDYNCKVISIITLKDLIAYLEEKPEMAEHLAAVKAYREEFGVLLTDIDTERAKALAERIRENVERLTGDNPEYAIPQKVTISIGAVVTQENALNPNEIYRLADNALYEAKETGRNKVVVRDVVNFCESP